MIGFAWRMLVVLLPSILALQGATVVAQQPADDVVQRAVAHAALHPDGTAPASFDASVYRDSLRQLPIGVFDSGIGGLTVLEAILSLDAFDNESLRPVADGRRDFQDERFVYLGDQANMPYGNYAAAGKEDFLRELILKDVTFLLGRRYYRSPGAQRPAMDKPPVKAIVIACNTATAYGLQDIRSALQAWQIPLIVVGVVEAGAQGVMQHLPGGVRDARSGDTTATVAVLATTGTCSSMTYPQTIGRVVGLAGKRPPRVIQHGSIGLAGAIEGDPAFVTATGARSPRTAYLGPRVGHPTAPLDPDRRAAYRFVADEILGDPSQPETWTLNSVRNYVRYEVASLVESYRRSEPTAPISQVVLGCTHFPLVKSEIAAALEHLRELEESPGERPYAALITEQVRFIDPAELTARTLMRELAKARLRADPHAEYASDDDLFYLSVANPDWPGVRLDATGGLDTAYKYGRSPGDLMAEDTRFVPMASALLPEPSVRLIRSRLPEVSKRLP